MAITDDLEARIAENRGATRQNKATPWLIRDDGMIFPNVPLIAKKQNFRPYHGDINASEEERQRYLQGVRSQRRVINSAAVSDDQAPLDISKATKEELIEHALEAHGVTIDPETHLNKIRADVARLEGLLPPLKGAGGGLKTPAAAA